MFVINPVFINLLSCFFIILLSYMGYKKTKNRILMYLCLAFVLFFSSHIMTFIGLKADYGNLFSSIRATGYLIILFSVWRIAANTPNPVKPEENDEISI